MNLITVNDLYPFGVHIKPYSAILARDFRPALTPLCSIVDRDQYGAPIRHIIVKIAIHNRQA